MSTQPAQPPAQPSQGSQGVVYTPVTAAPAAVPSGKTITFPRALALPIATILVVILAIVGGVDLIIHGTLSPDFQVYLRDVGIAAGLLGIGRGLDQHVKP